MAKRKSKDQQIIEILEDRINSKQNDHERYHQAVLVAATNLVNDPDNDRYWIELRCAVRQYDNEGARCRIDRIIYQRLLTQLTKKGIITREDEG